VTVASAQTPYRLKGQGRSRCLPRCAGPRAGPAAPDCCISGPHPDAVRGEVLGFEVTRSVSLGIVASVWKSYVGAAVVHLALSRISVQQGDVP
jgi:hypothetical protein